MPSWISFVRMIDLPLWSTDQQRPTLHVRQVSGAAVSGAAVSGAAVRVVGVFDAGPVVIALALPARRGSAALAAAHVPRLDGDSGQECEDEIEQRVCRIMADTEP
jgi:hypothetical protein